jgi:hypothetical protein
MAGVLNDAPKSRGPSDISRFSQAPINFKKNDDFCFKKQIFHILATTF